MAKKKSQKRPSRHERDNAGCIWGLISIFDFRHGRSSTKRLLTDRKRVSISKQAIIGDAHPSDQTILLGLTEKHESLMDAEESKMPMAEVAKTSVKELMEEEMFNEQGSTNYEKGSETIESEYLNHTKQHQPDNLDLESIMEELSHINQKKFNLETPPGESFTAVEEKLVEALKLFVEQKLSNNSKGFEEEDFKDALQTLSLNKGLFLRLLQNQDSDLVNHIQTILDARLGQNQTLSEENPKSDDVVSSRKQRNFFRRRSKSVDSSNPLVEEEVKDFQSPDKIVILKPTPETEKEMDNKSSQFSFTEIKRKLRHAMGKDHQQQGISLDKLVLKIPPKAQNWNNNNYNNNNSNNNGDKVGPTGENIGWSSPNRNHFYTERFAVLKENGSPLSPVVNKTYQYPKIGGSNIYVEAKKHLLEMMENGDENRELTSGKKLPKSLGRILSLPEYNNGSSPLLSPRKYGDDIFITAQMRLSPRGAVKNAQENNDHLSPREQSMEKLESLDKSVDVSVGDDGKCCLEDQSFTEDTKVSEVESSSSIVVEIEEMAEIRPQEEEKRTDVTSELLDNPIDGDIQKGDNEESASPSFKSNLLGEDQTFSSPTASPSHSPVSINIEDPYCEKMERPSPISVLDPLFTDDDISPASTISQPVEKEIQPRQIHFEEQTSTTDQGLICTRISLEEVESPFEYVEAVLLGSGLNWDEFVLRYLSLSEILDISLFEEVQLFSSRPHHDQKLLFDCANKALKEVCEGYFGKLHGKPNNRPVLKGMDLIQEIWKRVEWCLFQHPKPHSLDKLVKRDLEKTGDWMNLLSDIEVLVFEMEETIFEEVIEDTVMNFVDDTLECKFEVKSTDS